MKIIINSILLSHLTALHQLLVSSSVLVGGGSVLSSSDGLCGCSRRLLGSVLRNMKIHMNIHTSDVVKQ